MSETPDFRLALVLGGARSGKSSFAEGLIKGVARRPLYVATAQAFDAEMEARIAKHRLDRGDGWDTTEETLDLSGVLNSQQNDGVLVDCLTLWISNLMAAGEDVAARTQTLLNCLDGRAPVVMVSNEVGMGLVPETPLGRRFRDEQGRVNQMVATQADLVVLVVAGLPLVIKGSL